MTSPPRAADDRGTASSGPPVFTPQQEGAVHRAACEMVVAAVLRRPPPPAAAALGEAGRQAVLGAFVSLKRRGHLRGCCGLFGQPTPLAEAVARAAARTATEDARLPPVSPTELRYLDCEVWLLYGLQAVAARGRERAAAVVIGRHGVQIRRGQAAGLLLPGVAVEHRLDAEAFLREVCHKAGLPPTAWMGDDAHLVTFEGRAIAGPFDPRLAAEAAAAPPRFTEADAAQLAAHCRANILAILRGAMAVCYDPRYADGTVHGAALAAGLPGTQAAPRFSRRSLRPGLPLQATLFGLAEEAARTLRAAQVEPRALAGLRVELTLLWDPALHGTVDDPDLDGVDPATRAVLVVEGHRAAWVYHPDHASVVLVEEAAQAAGVGTPAAAWVVSLAAASTEPFVTVVEAARPQG